MYIYSVLSYFIPSYRGDDVSKNLNQGPYLASFGRLLISLTHPTEIPAFCLIISPDVNLHDRSLVNLPSMSKVDDPRRPHQPHEENARPIEVLRRHVVAVGPEAPEERPACIHQRDHVHGHPHPTERPASMGKRLLSDTFERHASDADDVGGHEGGGGEGEDCIEGDGGTDVDEGDDHGEEAGEEDGVDGDLPRGVDLSSKAND